MEQNPLKELSNKNFNPRNIEKIVFNKIICEIFSAQIEILSRIPVVIKEGYVSGIFFKELIKHFSDLLESFNYEMQNLQKVLSDPESNAFIDSFVYYFNNQEDIVEVLMQLFTVLKGNPDKLENIVRDMLTAEDNIYSKLHQEILQKKLAVQWEKPLITTGDKMHIGGLDRITIDQESWDGLSQIVADRLVSFTEQPEHKQMVILAKIKKKEFAIADSLVGFCRNKIEEHYGIDLFFVYPKEGIIYSHLTEIRAKNKPSFYPYLDYDFLEPAVLATVTFVEDELDEIDECIFLFEKKDEVEFSADKLGKFFSSILTGELEVDVISQAEQEDLKKYLKKHGEQLIEKIIKRKAALDFIAKQIIDWYGQSNIEIDEFPLAGLHDLIREMPERIAPDVIPSTAAFLQDFVLEFIDDESTDTRKRTLYAIKQRIFAYMDIIAKEMQETANPNIAEKKQPDTTIVLKSILKAPKCKRNDEQLKIEDKETKQKKQLKWKEDVKDNEKLPKSHTNTTNLWNSVEPSQGTPQNGKRDRTQSLLIKEIPIDPETDEPFSSSKGYSQCVTK